MAKWNPPEFTYHRYPDGTLVAVGSDGKPLACQPQLSTKTIEGVETVVDPWGQPVDEYEIPPFTVRIQQVELPTGKWDSVAVAVDADGEPVPFVPNMEIAGGGTNDTILVEMADGSTAMVARYDEPRNFFVHVTTSHDRAEAGTPEVEAIAVDASGNPLPVQPNIYTYLNEDGTIGWSTHWAAGLAFHPPAYEFPEFSVHLGYSDAALDGRTDATPTPIAVGQDGKPLAIQPDWQVDPADPGNVVAVMPDGQLRDAKPYEFPKYEVQLAYPAASYHGGAAPIPVAIAVDEHGVPLPIQPVLSVDPPDPGDPEAPVTVTATYGDQTTVAVEVGAPTRDFYVHVESSGLGGAHGGVSYAATAVDAEGQPLPIQPHLVVDPSDPSKVTAYFPDGTTSTPTPLYPPPGEPPDQWPPNEWPPASDTDEEDEPDDDTLDLPGEGSTVPTDDLDKPDDTAAPPDDMAAAPTDDVTVETTDPEPGDTAAPPDDMAAPTAEEESTSAPLGETFDAGDRYSGVEMAEGEVALDDDLNEPGSVDDLVTTGLDEPMAAEPMAATAAPEAAADDMATPVEEIEALMTAGLEPESTVEAAEFTADDAEFQAEDAEFEVDEAEFEVEEDSVLLIPMPTPIPPASEIGDEPVELLDVTEIPPVEPIEEATIEPIEILVEPLDTAPVREVTPIDEPDEPDRLVSEDEDDEEEPVQP